MRLLNILNSREIYKAFDSVTRRGEVGALDLDTLDSKKAYVNRVRRLVILLIDSKKPSTAGWKGATGQARKLAIADNKICGIVCQMIKGEWNKKALIGWSDFAAALLALHKLIPEDELCERASLQESGEESGEEGCEEDCEYCKRPWEGLLGAIVEECSAQNDDMRRRMHERKLGDMFTPRQLYNDSVEKPKLESTERKDISGSVTWERLTDWFEVQKHGETSLAILNALQAAVDHHEKPDAVIDMLNSLSAPPGYKTAAQRRLEENDRRAREAQCGDGFDLFDEYEEPVNGPVNASVKEGRDEDEDEGEGSVTDSRSPSPVLELADANDAPPEAKPTNQLVPPKKRSREQRDDVQPVAVAHLWALQDNIRALIDTYTTLLRAQCHPHLSIEQVRELVFDLVT